MSTEYDESEERRGALRIPVHLCLAAAGLLLALALLLTSAHAADQEFWDRPFAKPQYLVHITETNTDHGWEPRDLYLLQDKPPDANGMVLTSDSLGGSIMNKGGPAGGPYTTPRQVCDRVKSLEGKQVALGFDCRQLWALTDCRVICRDLFPHGTWDGVTESPPCDCRCEKGYENLKVAGGYECVSCDEVCWKRNQDPHSVYDRAESAVNVCACKCQTGYDDRNSDKCEKIECGSQGTNIADLKVASPSFKCPPHRMLNRHCCCDEGAQPWGGVCQKEVSLPPERRQWGAVTAANVKPGMLMTTLKAKDYQKPVAVTASTYKPETYPPGTVVFWAVRGTNSKGNPVYILHAHCSVIVNRDGDQMEMGATQVGSFPARGLPNPLKTKLTNATYEPHEIWLPPDKTKVKPGVGRLLQMPRDPIPKGNINETQKYEWNCHGFVDGVAKVYIAVPDRAAKLPPSLKSNQATLIPMRDPPGVPFTLDLQAGALYANGLALDVFLPDGFVEFTDEFLVEVGDDGSALIYVFDGHANVFSDGDDAMVHVPPDQMVTVLGGLASDPKEFRAGSLDRWWPASLSFSIGGLAVAAVCLAVLAGGVWSVWRVSGRRWPVPRLRRATTGSRRERARRPATDRAWGTLTVCQGRASPRVVSLDRPVLTIGRSSSGDVLLRDGLVSRRHAQIRRDRGAASIHDLASSNGTFLNGARITGSHGLHSGDVILLGYTKLVFESEMIGGRMPTPRPHRIRPGPQPRRVSLVLDRPVLTIGRGSASDLVLVDSHVSRRHAQIRREGAEAILYDLGSRNGTLVNGQRVTGPLSLSPGDVIRVGMTDLIFGSDGIQRRR